MGNNFFDSYSLLHFSSGVVACYMNVPVGYWFITHAVFEIAENSESGIQLINKLPFWPGGKEKADGIINMVGDQTSAILGWYFGKYIL